MPRPYLGPRVSRRFDIPVELDNWLTDIARLWGTDPEAGLSKNELAVRGLYLMRELMSGVPSPVSATLLDAALDRVNATMPEYKAHRRP